MLNWVIDFDPFKWVVNSVTGNTAEVKNVKPNPFSIKEKVLKVSSPEYIFPLKNKSLDDVISFYGEPRGNNKRIHEGIDIPDKKGAPILAVADGKIVKATNKGNAGKQIWLEVGSKTFFYAHLDDITVTQGQEVKQGDEIGTVGNTGNAKNTLPHLHFGIYVGRKTIDPSPLFK